MTTEKTIETKLRLGIESLGGLCIKIPATFFAGIPDRLCLLPGGVAFFVETKATGKKPRPRQIWVHNKLRVLGFKVFVVDSVEGVADLVDSYIPAGLTPAEEAELETLLGIRDGIKRHYPDDDLSQEDSERLHVLLTRKAGF